MWSARYLARYTLFLRCSVVVLLCPFAFAEERSAASLEQSENAAT